MARLSARVMVHRWKTPGRKGADRTRVALCVGDQSARTVRSVFLAAMRIGCAGDIFMTSAALCNRGLSPEQTGNQPVRVNQTVCRLVLRRTIELVNPP